MSSLYPDAKRKPAVTCAQCDSTAPLTSTEHGDLCAVCEHRQHEHDEAVDRFDHLSPSSFGFRYEDE